MMDTRSNMRDRILILAASFSFMGSSMLVSPLITGYVESLGAAAMLMGVTGGLMSLASLFSRPISGNLTDRIRKADIACVGAVLIITASVGYCTLKKPIFIVLMRVLHGLGFSLCSVSLSTWLSGLLPPDRMGEGMGYYGLMNALGSAVAPSLATAVYQRHGYLPALRLNLLFSGACLAAILLTRDKGSPPAEQPGGRRRLQIMDRRVLPVALIAMLFTLPYYTTQSFLLRYTETRALPVRVSLYFPVYAGSLLLLRFLLRKQFGRRPFRSFFFPAIVCLVGYLLCLALMRSTALLLCAAVFLAGSYGIMCTVCQSQAVIMVPANCRGVANGTYYIGIDLGMAVGPMLGGLLYERVNLAFFFPSLLLCAAASLAVYFCFADQLC